MGPNPPPHPKKGNFIKFGQYICMKKLNKKRSVVPLLTDPPRIKKNKFLLFAPPKKLFVDQ